MDKMESEESRDQIPTPALVNWRFLELKQPAMQEESEITVNQS